MATTVVSAILGAAVFVALLSAYPLVFLRSYRRNIAMDRPVVTSAVIGVIAASVWPLTLYLWFMERRWRR